MTSRDRVSRVKHLTRILRSLHFVELGNLPIPRVRIERTNSIELKLDPTIILYVVDSICRLRSTSLNYTSNIRVTLNVLFKFLIIFEVYSRLTKSTNITLELRYWHNNFESLRSLIELLKSYFELSIYLNY